jgi:hypothetical protein
MTDALSPSPDINHLPAIGDRVPISQSPASSAGAPAPSPAGPVPYERQHAVTISDHVHRLRQVR